MSEHEPTRSSYEDKGWETIIPIRRDIAKTHYSSPESTRLFIDQMLYPHLDTIVDSVVPKQETLVSLFESMKPLQIPLQVAPVHLSCLAIERHVELLAPSVLNSYQKGELGIFAAFCDLGLGMSRVVNVMLQIEGYSLTHDDSPVMEEIRAFYEDYEDAESPTTAGQKAELYVKAISRIKAYSDMLKGDPTGFTAIDKFIADDTERVLNNPSPMVVREFFIEGEKIAGLMYKKLYPRAKEIFDHSV